MCDLGCDASAPAVEPGGRPYAAELGLAGAHPSTCPCERSPYRMGADEHHFAASCSPAYYSDQGTSN